MLINEADRYNVAIIQRYLFNNPSVGYSQTIAGCVEIINREIGKSLKGYGNMTYIELSQLVKIADQNLRNGLHSSVYYGNLLDGTPTDERG